jgi:PIN domain nuclease of toxin-antitoxin system
MTRIHDSLNSDLEKLTLDTHVLIWYVEGIKLNTHQVELIDKACNQDSLFVSAISI